MSGDHDVCGCGAECWCCGCKSWANYVRARQLYGERVLEGNGEETATTFGPLDEAVRACVREALADGWPKCMNCGKQFTTADLFCECSPLVLLEGDEG